MSKQHIEAKKKSIDVDYQQKIVKYFLIAFGLHIPILCLVAYFTNRGVISTGIISAFILAGPFFSFVMNPKSRLTPVVIGIGAMAFSALLIHVGNGMIEMHFHVFVFLATLAVFGQIAPVLAGVVTIAVHHILFYFILPESLFNYQASFWIVLLHALFVIIEAVPVTYIAYKFGLVLDAQSNSLAKIVSITQTNSQLSSELSESSADLNDSVNRQASALHETRQELEHIKDKIQTGVKHLKPQHKRLLKI